MSFADEVREELCLFVPKKPCCRRALTAGLLIGATTTPSHLTVRYKSETVAKLAVDTIAQQYAKTPDVSRSGACGHFYYDLSVSSPALSKLIWQLSQEGADLSQILHFSCDACRASYLRGVFLAVGTVNDPHRSFHLEFALPSGANEALLSAFLTELGYPPRRVVRASGVGLYYKDAASVEDLVGMMGAQHTVFEIMNSRIEREIRNNENRATNCVAKNIEKTISAAQRQIEAINLLMEHNRLDTLPEPLRVTAMVRYRNPDATLDELVYRHDPPISKSGLNHRLKKIQDAADEI